MKIYIITLFPELFQPFLSTSIVREAQEKGKVSFSIINFREFAHDRHKTVDDLPYGGGAGMVIKVEPLYEAYNSIPESDRMKAVTIFLTPRAKVYSQQMANELASKEVLIFIAGHYKDFDERIFKLVKNHTRISIGDYVLSGGELPAMVVIDSVVRLVPGVISDIESAEQDSFGQKNPFLGAPSYTRPRSFMGLEVPEVLISGDHRKIKEWRKKESLRETYRFRPDLLTDDKLDMEAREMLEQIINEEGGKVEHG